MIDRKRLLLSKRAEGTSQTPGLDPSVSRDIRGLSDHDMMRVDCSKDSMPFRTDERSGKLDGFGWTRTSG